MQRWVGAFLGLLILLICGCTPLPAPVGTPTTNPYPMGQTSLVVPEAAKLTPVTIKLTVNEVAVASCPANLYVTPAPSQAVLICTQVTPTGVASVTATPSRTSTVSRTGTALPTTTATPILASTTPSPTASPISTLPASATPTPTNPAAPSVTVTVVLPTPTLVGGHANSNQMGLWVPTAFDTCPSYPAGVTTDAQKISYIEGIHDSYKVVGPDGLWYPTWHPPVDPATGCKFGHEHGDDPALARIYAQVQNHYAFTNLDGTKDLTHAGVPFGYVNVQMDTWTMANGGAMIPMRHEDHVGHKVATANDFPIGLDRGPGTAQFYYAGVTCSYIIEQHQGTHSKDAFENNLHEVEYNALCSDGHGENVDTMGEFGAPGQFSRICDAEGDRTTMISTGFSYSDPNYPADTQNGKRFITDRECETTGFLVPTGSFSANAYEAWPVAVSVMKPNGTPLLDGLNLLFDVEDSIRYYYPGHIDPVSGLVDNLGHVQDLCYENLNGRMARGGQCDTSTNFGQIKGITWDDPRAGFRGLSRGVYYKPGISHNAGGATIWYTDPFGKNAQTTLCAGCLPQFISADSTSYSALAGAGVEESANVLNEFHSDGGGSVHAPN